MDLKMCLKNHNIKSTKCRIKILDILSKANDALTVESIYNSCNSEGKFADLSTVYRSLDLFEEKNVVSKVDLGNGKYSYKIKGKTHKHILKCNMCNKEIEIECPMDQVEEIIKNKTGFVLIDHELKMKALCSDCMNKFNKDRDK
ncbi:MULTISPECIES: Fur family transcriptional regulator [Clostridium]|uniref:Fur family transcriptional regulator n=1 Tax=Clostridium TaxID=1485 RepID=UPI000826FE03|nr:MULTISPECIES: Fur family transcriptional regulator [Clostridium]PJI07366.1 transcriptional repressor [Clostridium sp. CT7]